MDAITARLALIRLASLRADRTEREEYRARQAALPANRRNYDWLDYCTAHGNYIGNPYGPDYLCGYCEDGTSDYAIALDYAHAAMADRSRRISDYVEFARIAERYGVQIDYPHVVARIISEWDEFHGILRGRNRNPTQVRDRIMRDMSDNDYTLGLSEYLDMIEREI